MKLHKAILKATRELPVTVVSLNTELDLTLFDNSAVTKHNFTLAESEIHFETRDGVLRRSIMITPTVGSVYPFKEFIKDHSRTSSTLTSSSMEARCPRPHGFCPWTRHSDSQTEETRTLANFLNSLGVDVTEVGGP